MALERHAPTTPHLAPPLNLWPTFGAYAPSYLLVSNYWVSHHRLLFSNRRIDRDVLWIVSARPAGRGIRNVANGQSSR